MRAQDDDGAELNAEYTVQADGPHLSLIMASAGGGNAPEGRNHQYPEALRLLLRRLGDRHAVLQAALVASAPVSALPESQRSLLPEPADLALVTDFERLRLAITTAQGNIGRREDAVKGGNNRKRLQLQRRA